MTEQAPLQLGATLPTADTSPSGYHTFASQEERRDAYFSDRHLSNIHEDMCCTREQVFNEGEHVIAVGFGWTRMAEIDIVTGTFTASFLLRLCYQEKDLQITGKHSTSDGSWPDFEKDCPNLPKVDHGTFGNVKEVFCEISTASLIEQVGTTAMKKPKLVQVDWWVRGTFYEFMELEDFPYDTQFLSIHIRNVIGGHKYNLVPWYEEIDFKFPCALQEFHVYQPVFFDVAKEDEIRAGSDRHRIIVKVALMRKSGYYNTNIIMILAAISALSFTTFFVPPTEDSIADMMGITLTLFLTSVAFRFIIQDKMPRVNYSTVMDKYILATMLFLFVVVVENMVMVWVVEKVAKQKSLRIREWTSGAIVVAWVFYHLHFIDGVVRFKEHSERALTEKAQEQRGKGFKAEKIESELTRDDRLVSWKIS